jgi:hypothetical protein
MVAQGLCFAFALASLACSGSAGKGGAGGGGGIGAVGGSTHTGGIGGATAGAGGGTGGIGAVGGTSQSGGTGGIGAVGGSSQSGGSGGANAGAGGGLGGIGGGSPSGGSGGGVATLTLPQCVLDLINTCPTTGSCVRSENDAGMVDICYNADGGAGAGGGVRTVFTPSHDPAMDCGFTGGGTTVVTKADGSPCYSFEAHEPQTLDCQTHTWTWKDASGQVVANGSLTRGANYASTITCAGGGARTTCSVPAASAATSCCDAWFGGSGCEAGPTCVAGACP